MLVHNICRSTRRFRGGRAGDFFWPAQAFAAVVFLCDLIFLPKQNALCGLGSVRARSIFPCRCGYFLLFLLLLLQIQTKKSIASEEEKENEQEHESIDCLARLTGATAFLG
jgi:hypothetical protein